MSLKNLVEGDCGGQNPLVKLSSHFTQDQAYQQHGLNSLSGGFDQSQLFVQEFLHENMAPQTQTFRMDSLLQEMQQIELANARSHINQAPNVAELAPRESSSIWSEEFLKGEKQYISNSLAVQRPKPQYDVILPDDNVFNIDFDKYKYDGVENEWVRNFLSTGASSEEIATTADSSSSKFVKFMNQPDEIKQLEEEEFTKWTQEFLNENPIGSQEDRMHRIFDEASASTSAEREQLDHTWNTLAPDTFETPELDYSNQFWKKFQDEWQKLSTVSGLDMDNLVDPYKDYHFEEVNPMKEHENPFEEGLKKLKDNDLPSAVLCFEAAAQVEPENPQVWLYLGTTQAENEQDPLAIAALKRCLELQPTNLQGIMSLAISYTNENFPFQACKMLKQWIRHNEKYSDLFPPEAATSDLPQMTSILPDDIHNEIQEMYIKAANRSPMGAIDPDVQNGLGVLFNLSNDYSKAVDCFKAALQAKPEDSRIWNRLGATLANGDRSAEAVDAYHHALELSPGYVRARYNLGITCVNLGAYREAIEHLLIALNQQANATNSRGDKAQMSDSIWSTLRLATNLLGRRDVLPALERRDVTNLNELFGFK